MHVQVLHSSAPSGQLPVRKGNDLCCTMCGGKACSGRTMQKCSTRFSDFQNWFSADGTARRAMIGSVKALALRHFLCREAFLGPSTLFHAGKHSFETAN